MWDGLSASTAACGSGCACSWRPKRHVLTDDLSRTVNKRPSVTAAERDTELKRTVLEYLGSVEDASIDEISDAIDADRNDTKAALRRLLDEGAVATTIDWNYQATATEASEVVERGEIEDGNVSRSEEEILELAARLDAYPYSGGSEAARMSGASKVARWLLGESDSMRVPGVEKRALECDECGWSVVEFVHWERVPRLCSECGAADSINAEVVED